MYKNCKNLDKIIWTGKYLISFMKGGMNLPQMKPSYKRFFSYLTKHSMGLILKKINVLIAMQLKV